MQWYARLGFSVVFEHRFAPGLPAFVGIERGGMHLYLSEHTGDAVPGTLVHLWVENVDDMARVLGGTVEEEPWGRMTDVTDPDGNRLRIGTPHRDPAPPAESVLVTGISGVGKSTVVEDIAELLEDAGVAYGAIDLDWLMCYDTGPGGAGEQLRHPNLVSVVSNYRAQGIDRFALAGYCADVDEVESLRAALGMELTVVELSAPFGVIEGRLEAEGTPDRLGDLERARIQVTQPREGWADFVVDSARPVREVSSAILDRLGWLA